MSSRSANAVERTRTGGAETWREKRQLASMKAMVNAPATIANAAIGTPQRRARRREEPAPRFPFLRVVRAAIETPARLPRTASGVYHRPRPPPAGGKAGAGLRNRRRAGERWGRPCRRP